MTPPNAPLKLFQFMATLALVILAISYWYVRRQRLLANRTGNQTLTLKAIGKNWWQTGYTIWREVVQPNEQHKMQVIVGLTGALLSVSIGYSYARAIWVAGWQLWTWFVVVVVVVLALLPLKEFPRLQLTDAKLLLLITAIAFVLRLFALDQLPAGLHGDERIVAEFAVRHAFPADQADTLNPFRTGALSQPALYHYLIRLTIALFGYSFYGVRISSAIAGSLAIAATYAIVYLIQDRRTAIFTAIIMTTYHYHVHWSRLVLNNIWDTLWVPAVLLFFVWGWRHSWSGGAVLSGLALGLSQYFYSGNKISFFLLPFVIIFLYRQERDQRRLLIHASKLLVIFVTVAAPITIFALIEPNVYFYRSREVFGWQSSAVITAVGDYDLWRYLGYQLWHNLGAFTTLPEITGFYRPHVPFLIGLAAPLFLIGFFWSMWQRQFLPVLWILLTVFFGGIMLNGSPSSSHYVVSIPAICWLTAVPLAWLGQRGRWRLAFFLLTIVVVTDLIFYFAIFAQRAPGDLSQSLPPWPFDG